MDGSAELYRFASDVAKAAEAAVKDVDPIVRTEAHELKDQMNSDLAGSRHFRGAAGSVTYDSRFSVGTVGYEVGPDKGRRGGAIANIAYFGGSNGGGGTVDLDGTFKAAGDALEKNLDKFLGGLL
ncbi:MAG: hypothetical protein K0S70_206 [Microbacterium sp.]|jgi:hypothetical protein|nr:hypothetical protein [Microbacterium sp.]